MRVLVGSLVLLLVAGGAIAPGPVLTPGRVTFTSDGMAGDGANLTRLYTTDATTGYRLYLGNLTDAPYLTSGAADTISTPDTLQVDGRAKLSHTNSSICLGDGASTYDACLFRSTTSEVQASDDLAVTDDLRVGDDGATGGDLTITDGTEVDGDHLLLSTGALLVHSNVIGGQGSAGIDGTSNRKAWVGLLIVSVALSDNVCWFILRGTDGATEISDPQDVCSTNAGLNNKFNVYYQSPYTRVQNRYSSGYTLVTQCICYYEAT